MTCCSSDLLTSDSIQSILTLTLKNLTQAVVDATKVIQKSNKRLTNTKGSILNNVKNMVLSGKDQERMQNALNTLNSYQPWIF